MSEVKQPNLLYMDSRAEDSAGYTFALNGESVNKETRGFLASELGNSLAFNISRLGADYIPLGFIPFSGETGILISVRDDEEKSQIGLVHNSTYTALIIADDLGFTKAEQIQGTYKIINGCEKVIVFRAPTLWAINVDNLDQYLLPGETQASANATGNGWDVSLMKLFFDYTFPTMSSITIEESNGSLPLGTYQVISNYLDASLNEAGWMNASLPIPIVDESFADEFTNIDGGLNANIPPTSKSIVVTFDDLDLSFSYLRVALIANNDGVRTIYKIVDYPITSSSHTITLSSITGEGVTTIPTSEIALSKIVYDEAETLTQTENRLIIGAPTEKYIDHALFQRMANEIKAAWVKKELDASDSLEGNKSPSMYLDSKSFMSNEVYSIGIVVQFTDGYETPVYHIPGRIQNYGYRGDLLPEYIEPNTWHNRPAPQGNWDSSLLVVNTHIDLEDVEHLGFETATTDIGYGAGLVPRWKCCNTAIKLNIPSDSYDSIGEMAYWESELPYPNTVDCDGLRIFPEGNIRHHKMPDVTLTPHYLHNADIGEDSYSYFPLGLLLSNIVIPTEYQDEVIGYKIVREKRSKNNTSVFDKGMLTTCLHYYDSDDDSDEVLFQPYPYNYLRLRAAIEKVLINERYGCFHAPKLKFSRDLVSATHLKLDQKLLTAPFQDGREVAYYTSGPVEYRSYAQFKVDSENSAYIPAPMNRKILKQAYMDSDSILTGYFDIEFDNTEQEETYALNFSSALAVPNDTWNIDGYRYLVGKNETDHVEFYYGGLEIYSPSQYGFLGSGAYVICHSNLLNGESNIVYGGDTFISRLYFRRHARITNGPDVIDWVPVNHDETADFIDSHLVSFFVESTINCGLRHEGEAETEVYYPKSYIGAIDDFLEKERYLGPTPSIDDDLIPNYYGYNFDYSAEPDYKYYFTLPENYDYCQTCQGEFLNRLAWTKISNSENNMTPWRTFLVNDYVDLTQDKGRITNIFIDDYKLYVQTVGSILYVPTNYQTVSSNESDLYIGTGQFMGLGGKELKSLKEGYGGSESQWATCTTEVGTFIVSEDKVFLLSQGSLVEVSRKGLTNFFIENKMKFYRQFYDETGIEYPYKDNPSNLKGLGFLSARKPSSKCWVLSKKDYKMLFEVSGIISDTGSYTVDEIYWNNELMVFQKVITSGDILTAEFEDIEFWDSDYFQNLSYTLSFDLDELEWISFHSYLPYFMYSTASALFTYAGEGIYEHGKGEYRKFYGVRYPFIVDFPVLQNYMQANITNTVQFVCHGAEFDSVYNAWKQLPEETFNKIWLYNDSQSSGILNIVKVDPVNPYDTTEYTPGSVFTFKADKTWNVDGFYNYATAQPLYSKRWEDLQTDYYIDKVPLNTDSTINQLSLERFRDGYINCRLIYDADVDRKLLFKYLRTYDIPSIR